MRAFLAVAAVAGLLSALTQSALAASIDACHIARAESCNTPDNRACWSDGFDINTDYEENTPTTGVTREYVLNITEENYWTGPDGVVKNVIMLINGSTPGPVITADWGDYLSVTVHNNLKTNGSSLHWHGIRQLNTSLQDGANGATECPIPPGGVKTYKFRAVQYGTTWYHSHFSAQYGNGVFGTIMINGPASANYDEDLGVFPVGDYYYDSADDLILYTKMKAPPPSDNVLFNGTNVHPQTGAGHYASVTLTPNKTHRLRLINPSVENHYALSLVSHQLTVIANDLVPVQPMTVDSVFLAPGQRYDVLITANQAVDNYWFNVTFSADQKCGASNNTSPAAIFRYAGAPDGLPTVAGNPVVQTNCTDIEGLVPVVKRTVPVDQFSLSSGNIVPVTSIVNTTSTTQIYAWAINASKYDTNWNAPVVDYVLNDNLSYSASENVVSVEPSASNQWTFWLVSNDASIPIPHPVHLHGHDYVMLARSNQHDPSPPAFDAATVTLNGDNPPRRDVTMLPAHGWMLIAFKLDNPGAWLMHCHIAWHASGGFGMTFVESAAAFRNLVTQEEKDDLYDNCKAWDNYFPHQDPHPKIDSGI